MDLRQNNHHNSDQEETAYYKKPEESKTESEKVQDEHEAPEADIISSEKAAAASDTETWEEPKETGIPAENDSEGKVKKKRPFPKSLAASFGAGVMGAAITLAVIPFTGYPDLLVEESNSQPSAVTTGRSEDLSTKGAVEVQASAVSQSEIADMVEEASDAIVGVVNIQKQQLRQGYLSSYSQQQSGEEDVESGYGSGVIFKVEGDTAYIVTNNHVIEDASEIEVDLASGESTTAELVGADALSDLAVLKIDAQYANAVLEFGDSSVLRSGEQVIAIGNPLGQEFAGSVTQGIVSAVDRAVEVETSAGEWALNTIQTDAAINPGNSGGALMNTQGQVIGINSLKISEDNVEGIGFAIPSNDVVPLINEIIETGKVERAYLGVGLADLASIPEYYLQDLPDEVEGGIIITNVEEGSAASNAGLKVQDVITAINDTEVQSAAEFRKALYNDLNPGDEATLTIYRSGEAKKINITLGSTTAS
ncbi:MAG: S1C family serine protease [Bacillus sp. (in: firmicutes)]